MSSTEVNPTETSVEGPIKDLSEVITKAQACTNANELEIILVNVKPGCGNCTSRRKLKRILDNHMKSPEFQAQLNAKSRRKFQRWLQILKPDPEVNKKQEAENAAALAAAAAEKQNEKKKAPKKEEIVPNAPCVAFIGQLSFTTTVEDVQTHFQNNGINGPIKVRLLTHPETKQPRGTAFVEFEGPRELRKALSLHHSYLNGRRINVEKSCGGSNKESRTTKIKQLQEEQRLKNREILDGILKEYADKGLIDMENISDSLYSSLECTNILDVRIGLDNFAETPEESRSESELMRQLYLARRKRNKLSGLHNSNNSGDEDNDIEDQEEGGNDNREEEEKEEADEVDGHKHKRQRQKK